MRKRNFRFLFVLLPVLMSTVMSGQTPAFTASVSSARISENSVFDVRFELSDAQGEKFTPPSFSDFRVVGGPARGSSTYIINGQVNRTDSWSYSLLATRKGKYTIGAATIIAGRKKLTTKPIQIEVVEARDLPGQHADSEAPEIHLIAEAEERAYYPGQQINLRYKILFRESVQTVNVIAEDEYKDFFLQSFGMFSKEPEMVMYNGKQYTARIVKSLALFPHKSGEFTIQPMIMDVGVNAPFPGVQGFFTMHRLRDVRVASPPLVLRVLPLPDAAPASFHGAVGKYTVDWKADKTQLTTDDALTISMLITGNGDARRWDPPVITEDSLWEIFPPKILRDETTEREEQILHQRQIEYQLIPLQTGQLSVPLAFTYFDPAEGKYVTIKGDTIQVHVTPGKNPIRTKTESEISSTPATLMEVRQTVLSDRFWCSLPHLFLFGLVLTGSGFTWWTWHKKRKEANIPDELRRQSSAGIRATDSLDQIRQEDGLSDRQYFEKMTEVYHRFLCERYQIPPAELDEVHLPAYVSRAKVADPLASQIALRFQESLIVRYGGIPSGFSKEVLDQSYREIFQQG